MTLYGNLYSAGDTVKIVKPVAGYNEDITLVRVGAVGRVIDWAWSDIYTAIFKNLKSEDVELRVTADEIEKVTP